MRSKEEIEALLLEVLPALPAELLADGEALREQLGAFPSSGELVDELASTLSLLHEHAPPVPELSLDFADKVMAALPPAPQAATPPRGGRFEGWVLRAAAAAACFALGVGYARWQPTPDATPSAQQQPAPAQAPSAPPQAPTQEPPLRGWELAREPQTTPPPVTYVDTRALGDYATRARHVLETLDRLGGEADPRALHEVLVAVEANELVLRGEVLLAELEVDPQRPQELSRLIHGTQLVLRRVRNARGPAASTVVNTVRDEVRATGLLDAYETLLAAPSGEQTPPPIQSTGPL
ncbi:MAG: hypothetical protein R3F62_04890 [Planctomycetota bacterium]